MKIKSFAAFLSVFLFASTIFFGVANATWNTGVEYNASTADSTFTGTTQAPVARIGSTYYATIEKALAAAKSTSGSQTVEVLPGTNPTISSPCEIASEDTLVLSTVLGATSFKSLTSVSTDSSTYFNPITASTSNTNYFADGDATKVSTNRKNNISIAANVKLTVKGTLNISGVTGNSGQLTSAQTTGSYAQISLSTGATIDAESGSRINCFGYIKDAVYKGQGTLNLKSGASVVQPFVIYDFAGGQNTCGRFLGAYNIDYLTLLGSPTITLSKGQANICPFEIFDLPNIQCKYNIYSGSSIVGATDLYADSAHHPVGINIFGNTSDYLVEMTTGYLTAEYNASTFGYTAISSNTDTTYTALTFHNGSDPVLNSMQMNVSVSKSVVTVTAVINTAVVKFPISYRYDITLESGSDAVITNDLKVMPGCDFVVNEGASITFNGSTVFYKNFTDTKSVGKYPSNYKDSSFLLNGTASFNGETGVFINTSNGNAKTVFGANYVNNSTDQEGDGSGVQDNGYTFSFTATSTAASLRQYCQGYIGSADNVDYFSNSYTYYESSSSQTYWVGAISHSLQGVSISAPNGSSISDANTSTNYSFSLTAALSPVDADNISSYSWVISSGSSASLSSATGSSTTLTIKSSSSNSTAVSATVSLTVTDTDGHTFSATITCTCTTKAKSCVLPQTLVTMADGTQKAVEDVATGDLVKVFNHETGAIDVAPITFNDYESAELVNVINLYFSNGSYVGVVSEHGFFDLDTMRYEYIDEHNYEHFIGHRFYGENGDAITLVDAYVGTKYTEVYSPTSFYHLDYFTEGILSMPGGITGLFNIFEYGDDLAYEPEAYARDIETYGLFTYEDLAPLGVTEIMFEAYAGKYLKVALGKGILTEEYLAYLIDRYGGFTD